MAVAPRWFMIVSVLALLWNIAGLLAFVSDAMMGPDDVAQLSAAEQALYAARPAWAVLASALATMAGTLGSLALVMRKRWALPLLILSLVGVVGQDAGFLALPGGLTSIGAVPMVLQGIVLLISIGLVLLARRGIASGWLG